MAVPHTFGNQPNGTVVPLAWLDENFAAVGGGGAASIQMDALTITVYNSIPKLSQTYSSGMFMLIVNGSVFCPVGSPAPFSVSGKTVTWLSSVFGVNPGDTVVAIYTY